MLYILTHKYTRFSCEFLEILYNVFWSCSPPLPTPSRYTPFPNLPKCVSTYFYLWSSTCAAYIFLDMWFFSGAWSPFKGQHFLRKPDPLSLQLQSTNNYSVRDGIFVPNFSMYAKIWFACVCTDDLLECAWILCVLWQALCTHMCNYLAVYKGTVSL